MVPSSALSRLHLLLQVHPVLRVEPGRRLVEEEDRRLLHQPDRHVQPAPLTPGELGDRTVGVLGEVERLEQLLGPGPGVAAGQAVGAGLADELVAPAVLVSGGVALTDVPDRAPDRGPVADDVEAGDLRRPRSRADQRGQHPERRRLAGAVRTEERDQLAGRDLQVEAANGLDRLLVARVVAGEPDGADHRPPGVHLVVVGHDHYARNQSGQFLTSIRSKVEDMSTSARMLRLLSLLQTHRFWSGVSCPSGSR